MKNEDKKFYFKALEKPVPLHLEDVSVLNNGDFIYNENNNERASFFQNKNLKINQIKNFIKTGSIDSYKDFANSLLK